MKLIIKTKTQIILLICFSLLIGKAYAQYEPGDTILIPSVEYKTVTIEAEWNATNESPIEGKNVPMELDGRTVIGNTKTGSILSYSVMVGAEGGSFVMSVIYKGFTGAESEGYMYLWFDDRDLDRDSRDKILLNIDGWNTATSKTFHLTPGFHTIYTQYKGNSGTFHIDKYLLDAIPGTLKEKEIRQIFALSYEPDTIQAESYDEALSFAKNGAFTVEGEKPAYVSGMQTGDTLTYPFRVGSGGGSFNLQYVYKKLSDQASSIKLLVDKVALETLSLNTSVSDSWEAVNSTSSLTLTPGYHQIEIVPNGSNDHVGDYFVLIPVGNSLYNAHPTIWIDAHDKAEVLDKIEKYTWAKTAFKNLKEEISADVFIHQEHPEEIFKTIPEIGEDVHYSKVNELESAVTAAIIYYLTSEEPYAQYAADIFYHYADFLADKTPQTATVLGNAFDDTRWPFKYMALVYDFIYGYLNSPATMVLDSKTGERKAINFSRIQKAMANIAGYGLNESGGADTHGRDVSNWHILQAPGVLYSILCIEDEVERERLFNVFWNVGTKQQASFKNTVLPMFGEQGIWPESMSYSFQGGVPVILNIIDRLKPELNAISDNVHILEGSFLFPNLRNPNRKFIRFGDAKRLSDGTESYYRSILNITNRKGLDELKKKAEVTLVGQYEEAGGYTPGNNPLELFWGEEISDTVNRDYDYSTTVLLKHAGIALQRNYVESNNELYGLNGYIGGAHYVHSHCTGIAMELYGAGYIMAANGGTPPSPTQRGEPVHTDYFRIYAGNNTVIVNGTSHGLQKGAWKSNSNIWQNDAVNVASEPLHLEEPVSKNFSFATQFLKDEVNNCDQKRTLSIIRTSETTGYYFDMFRSKSLSSNKFHDYVYHNLGDEMHITNSEGSAYALSSTNRYNNDIGDIVHSPGWRFFENEKVTEPTTDELKIRFDINHDNTYMHMIIPGGVEREYTSAVGPPTREAQNGYDDKETQILAIRQPGEAWKKPYIAVFEPNKETASSVKSVEHLIKGDTIVGAIVSSEIDGTTITDYILAFDEPSSLELKGTGIVFNGLFGVVRKEVKNDVEKVTMYIGAGEELTYGDTSLKADDKKRGLKTFEQIPLQTYSVNASATNGSLSTSPQLFSYVSGTEISISALPDTGYKFSHWSGDVSEEMIHNMPLTVEITNDMNIVANFIQITHSVNASATNGSVTISPELAEYAYGTEINLTAIADNTYRFSYWSGDVPDSIINSMPLNIAVFSDLEIVANFEKITYSVNVSATNGTLTIDPELAEYEAGSEITLIAIPDEGYKFSEWSGDVPDSLKLSDTITVSVEKDLQIEAGFELNTGFDSFNNENFIKVYPNPSDGMFAVEAGQGEKCTYKIFSIAGSHVQQGVIQGLTNIDLRHAPKGTYILEVETIGTFIRNEILIK